MRLGRRYLGAYRWRVAVYAVGMLLTTSVLPVQIASRFGYLTNFFQSGAVGGPGPASAPQRKRSGPATTADRGARDGGVPSELSFTYAAWVALVLAEAVLGFVHRYQSAYFGAKVEQAMQADLFENVLRQSPRFYHEHPPGELTLVVSRFSSQARMGLFQLLVDPIVQVVSVVVIATTLYRSLTGLGTEAGSQIYIIFAVITAFAFVAPMLVLRVGRVLQRQQTTVQRQDLAMATLVSGSVSSPEEIQAMEAEPIFAAKYRALLGLNLRSHIAQTATIERLNLLNSMPGSIVLIAVIGTAIYILTQQSTAAGGTFGVRPEMIVKVGLLTPMLMGVIQSLASFSINARMVWPGLEVVDTVLASRSEVETAPGAMELPRDIEPTVQAHDVAFSYEPGRLTNVLDGVSFALPAKQVVGLVARPGRGKTTIFRLLLRFYDPQRGALTIGGFPVRTLTLTSLRRSVALMTQSSAFFHDSVRENFRIASPEASDDEIRSTCERTCLWPILTDHFGAHPLDASFAAGQLLSGGQKKLFALTRLLLQQPSVVLLDEPTVGMGPLEKGPLVEVMRRACEGRTVVAVDHDILWMMSFCDRFLVLDDGRIVQDGTAPELLAESGLFRELHDSALHASSGQQRDDVAAMRQPPVPAMSDTDLPMAVAMKR